VILTALAAVLAFIPLTHSVFWGAMACTLIGGTAIGTVLIGVPPSSLRDLVPRTPRCDGDGNPVNAVNGCRRAADCGGPGYLNLLHR
jgi:hypothetical protein